MILRRRGFMAYKRLFSVKKLHQPKAIHQIKLPKIEFMNESYLPMHGEDMTWLF